MKVDFFKHNVSEDDAANVTEALGGPFLTTGRWVERFEKDLAAWSGSRRAVGVTSCTAGLHIALSALGIGPGDEVITTPASFVATANAVVMAGAKPVFVDVEADTGNLEARLVEAAVTTRTKAILPVHLYGVMCDMRRLQAIADEHSLKVIEDAAHAFEAERDGVRPGELSDAAVLSFYATKSITSGEGGAVLTNDDALADTLKVLRLHGVTKSAAERHGGSYEHYDMARFGWKYNMSNIQAALLSGQLARAGQMRARREEIAHCYMKGLSGLDGLDMPEVPESAISGWHLFTIWVEPERRDEVLLRLGERGVGVAVNYRPIHLMSYYREALDHGEGDFPEAERIGASTISLPLYPKLQKSEIEHVIESVRASVS